MGINPARPILVVEEFFAICESQLPTIYFAFHKPYRFGKYERWVAFERSLFSQQKDEKYQIIKAIARRRREPSEERGLAKPREQAQSSGRAEPRPFSERGLSRPRRTETGILFAARLAPYSLLAIAN